MIILKVKSLHALFDTYLDCMLAKFDPNRMVRNVQKFELLDKKPSSFKTIFDKALTSFCKTFLYLKQLFSGKLLIFRLTFFGVTNIMAFQHV